MHQAYAAQSPYGSSYGWQPVVNPNRAWWIVGGILAAGGVLAGGAFLLARRQAAASVVPAPPVVVGPPSPTEGAFGEFQDGSAPLEAKAYYAGAKSNIRRLIFLYLDQEAGDKGIQKGWQAPKLPSSGGFGFDPQAEPVTLGLAQKQLPPAKGPENWSQEDAWKIATKIYNGQFKEMETYDDLAEWTEVVGSDGPPSAWLKGIIAAELMRLTQAEPTPVDGEVIDWSTFAVT